MYQRIQFKYFNQLRKRAWASDLPHCHNLQPLLLYVQVSVNPINQIHCHCTYRHKLIKSCFYLQKCEFDEYGLNIWKKNMEKKKIEILCDLSLSETRSCDSFNLDAQVLIARLRNSITATPCWMDVISHHSQNWIISNIMMFRAVVKKNYNFIVCWVCND